MNPFIVLLCAIVSEVVGTAALKASEGFTKPFPTFLVIAGHIAAFYFMAVAMKNIPLGTTYAIWSGLGTAGTVAIGVLLWQERLEWLHVLALVLIIIGVVLLNVVGETKAA